ncbi:MAG: MFS transporter [Pseudomonadota bacterium]
MRSYLFYVFLSEFILGYAVYTAFFQLQGLDPAQIGLLFALWAGAGMVFEVPSGILSDRYDRRLLLALSPLLKALCFVVWALVGAGTLTGALWVFALGFLFWSAGSSLKTGTKEALLYERLRRDRCLRFYERILGREQAMDTAGITLGAVLGGFVGQVSFTGALWLSVPPLVLAALVAVALKDGRDRRSRPGADQGPGRGRLHSEASAYLRHLRQGLSAFKTRKELRLVALYLAFGITCIGALEEFDQLLYRALALPVWSFGLIMGSIGLCHMVASLTAHRLKAYPVLLWLLPLISGVGLLAFGLADRGSTLAFYFLAYAAITPLQVIATARFQRAIGPNNDGDEDGESRATTTSFLSLFMAATEIAFMLLFGLAMDKLGILPAYQAAGLYLLGFAVWAFWRGRRATHRDRD